MGEFAVNVAVVNQIGAARGDYSIFSAMDIRDSELFAALGQSIHEVIGNIAKIWNENENPGVVRRRLMHVGLKTPAFGL